MIFNRFDFDPSSPFTHLHTHLPGLAALPVPKSSDPKSRGGWSS